MHRETLKMQYVQRKPWQYLQCVVQASHSICVQCAHLSPVASPRCPPTHCVPTHVGQKRCTVPKIGTARYSRPVLVARQYTQWISSRQPGHTYSSSTWFTGTRVAATLRGSVTTPVNFLLIRSRGAPMEWTTVIRKKNCNGIMYDCYKTRRHGICSA